MNTQLKKLISTSILCTLLFFTITSCKKDNPVELDPILEMDYAGLVSKIETLGYYSAADAVSFLQLGGLPGKAETTSGFNLYRITYASKNYDNTDIRVSGLLAVPDSKSIKGIVSWQHGTNPDRKEAPSKPTPAEGIAISALFAGNDYILIAPDYIGLGVSNVIPTYLHTQSTVNTSVDFMKIASIILKKLTNGKNENLYLVGFSQGGSATAGIHRALEMSNTTGLTLKASACIAGAYDLRKISIPYAIANKSTLYLGYVANAYSVLYNQSLSSIITPKYVSVIPELFDGSKNVDEIESALPNNPEDLFRQDMISDIMEGKDNWFTLALEQNETYKWKPVTKLKLFYGTKDTDVSAQDAIAAYDYMKSIGGNVDLINTGDYDHTGTLLQSLPEIQLIFNNTK